jgi:predicted  nucleic acid-binding Zn-ribbon protein
MIGKRISNLWRAMVGAQLTELEAGHAEATLDLERERLRRQVLRFNSGLAGHAAMCEGLRRRIARLQEEAEGLPARVDARRQHDDRAGAGRHALRLEQVEAELSRAGEELSQAECTYRERSQSREEAIAQARGRIGALRRGIGEMRMQEALADLTEMAADLQGQVGLSDGTLERIRARVEERRDYAKGRARVARDALNDDDSLAQRAERQALAEAALSRFEERKSPEPNPNP